MGEQQGITVEKSGRQSKGYAELRDREANKMDTLKVLLPLRPCQSNKSRSRMDTTGLLGTLMYTFLTPVFWKAHRQGISQATLMRLMSDREAADINCHRFEKLWREETGRYGDENASLKRVSFRFIRTRFLTSCGVLVVGLCSGFLLTAYLLYMAILYLEGSGSSWGYCLGLAASILASTSCRVVGMNFSWYLNIRTAARLRNALMLALYKKVSRLQRTAEISVAEMVNICVNDMQRLFDAAMFGPVVMAFPLFVLLILAGCVLMIGVVPTLLGTLMLIVIFSCQACLAKVNIRIRQHCIAMTDSRTRLLNEILNCMKLIKMYAWEESFARNVTGIRRHESRHLQQAGYLSSYTLGMALTACPAVILTAVICNKLMGNDITAAQAFTLMQLFGSLSTMMYILPIAMKPITESIVAIQRIQPILLMDEVSQAWEEPEDPGHALVLSNASFSWEAPPEPHLVPRPVAEEEEEEEEVVSASASAGEMSVNEDAPHGNNNADANAEDRVGKWVRLLQDGDKSPSATPMPILKDLSLVLPKSHLVGVCGAVGSGKSSLLSCLLDQMNLLGGKVELTGTFAYAAQQAWITNATVRENILFGKPYDEVRYKKAVYSCCLERDLQIMADGDRTEIGERGVNVSGGQKQRISLARAYYSDRDVYLLDDPLSAVDAHVGKHIFTHCIRGALGGKTVLFVSHQLQYLRDCDHVIFMQEGAIAEQGTHDQLMAAGGEYARLLDTFHGSGETRGDGDGNDDDGSGRGEGPAATSNQPLDIARTVPLADRTTREDASEAVKLMTEEDRGSGMVAYATYRSFVKYAGGPCLAVLIAIFMFLSMLAAISTNVWLSVWIHATVKWKEEMDTFDPTVVSESSGTALPRYNLSATDYEGGGEEEDRTSFFILVYVGIFLMCFIILGISCLLYITTLVRATTRIHDCLLRKIMRCPMSFFDTTPLGRILNRFTKDMDEVDLMLPVNLMRCLMFASLLVVVQLVIGFVLPYYLLAFALTVPAGLAVYALFRRGYCEIKRYDNTSRSRLVSHVSATVQGLVTIRAYGQQQRFTSKFEELLDVNSHALLLFTMAPRWVAVRMDILCTLLVGVLTLMILLSKDSVLSPALAAMALYQAIMISGGLLQEVVLSSTQTESSFISVERILEYIEKSPSEAAVMSVAETKPPPTWPDRGDLRLFKVEMRYRPELPLVLKGITCHIQPGEKIGIVGRTGSGKSSLGVALFRLVELSSGRMSLDGLDISTLGLHDLRSRLSIIPQDPVLFAGTVRFNLDPLHEHWDQDLWDALDKTYLKQMISDLDKQLEAPVIENGENFSVGERQLICMARVLLRNSKVLLMDEATAAIDTETDSLIQQTIREAFKDCTMLIIAHRLNTVLDCDRIMVLDKGQIVEFGTPDVLVADPYSHLSQMLSAMERSNQGVLPD